MSKSFLDTFSHVFYASHQNIYKQIRGTAQPLGISVLYGTNLNILLYRETFKHMKFIFHLILAHTKMSSVHAIWHSNREINALRSSSIAPIIVYIWFMHIFERFFSAGTHSVSRRKKKQTKKKQKTFVEYACQIHALLDK